MTTKIVLVYQSLLGVYGDRGNATVLVERLRRRNIDADLVVAEPGDVVPDDAAVYLLGGGEDQAQVQAVKALREDGNVLRGLDKGAVLFAVCAGYQILGKSFTIGETDVVHQGLGLLDVTTRRGDKRAVGEVLHRWTRPDGSTSLITGFENHGGHTTLGSEASPLASVEKGVGNCGDGTEGAVQGNIIGCYPHGPVLVRNPDLADHLLEKALGRELPPLPMPSIDRLRAERIQAIREG